MCESYKIFKNTYFVEHLQMTASRNGYAITSD